MPQTIRSFIAIELPSAVADLLGKMQQDLRATGLRAAWVKPQNIHLTLKFLGDIKTGGIDAVASAMKAAAEDCAPFTLGASGIGFFPGIKRPRVIWVGVGGQIQPLFALQRNLEDCLAAAGFPKDNRSFKGHLTLGRFRQDPDPAAVARILQSYSDFDREEFSVHRIVLFKSELAPSGAVYSQLLQAELCGMTNVE
jgi:2'-5' RNA ligase